VVVLGGLIYQTYLFLLFCVEVASNKKVFIRWMLTLFKIAQKTIIFGMLNALILHKPIDGWILSLPIIINSCKVKLCYILLIIADTVLCTKLTFEQLFTLND